jgi:hypothetical protein
MRIEKIIALLSEGSEADIWADTGQQSTEQTEDQRAGYVLCRALTPESQIAM